MISGAGDSLLNRSGNAKEYDAYESMYLDIRWLREGCHEDVAGWL